MLCFLLKLWCRNHRLIWICAAWGVHLSQGSQDMREMRGVAASVPEQNRQTPLGAVTVLAPKYGAARLHIFSVSQGQLPAMIQHVGRSDGGPFRLKTKQPRTSAQQVAQTPSSHGTNSFGTPFFVEFEGKRRHWMRAHRLATRLVWLCGAFSWDPGDLQPGDLPSNTTPKGGGAGGRTGAGGGTR